MAQQTINVGTTANDGTGDTLRSAFQKTQANFSENYTSVGTLTTATTALKVFQIAGEITAPGNRAYTLDLAAPFAYTITALKVQTAAGTCTCAVQIGGTNVTGISAVSTSTTLATGTASAANSVAADAKVTLVVSSVSGASELQFSLRATRT